MGKLTIDGFRNTRHQWNAWQHVCALLVVVALACVANVHSLSCPSNTWQCNNAIQCINATLRCNNIVDCTDGSDEGVTCSMLGFAFLINILN